MPLAFCGSYFGFKRDAVEVPCKYNQIPRQIPEQQWYMHPVFSILIGGVLPFGAIFIEFFSMIGICFSGCLRTKVCLGASVAEGIKSNGIKDHDFIVCNSVKKVHQDSSDSDYYYVRNSNALLHTRT